MEQIKILFFVLTSFFGIENGQIAAEKTTVIISPKSHEITIIQDHLFTIIQSKKDTIKVLKQWKKILNTKKDTLSWAKDLDSFTTKTLTIKSIKKTIQPHLKLNYSTEKDLRVMGIWYNEEKNQFSINHIPQHNLKTTEGQLVDNYWVFDGNSTFSFTLEPFLQMPENYQQFKKPLIEIIN